LKLIVKKNRSNKYKRVNWSA